MRFLFAVLAVVFSAAQAQAVKLSDYKPYEYDVRFTNPICQEYKYEEKVVSRAGKALEAKPKNAFCKKADSALSAKQEGAPIKKLLEWINDPATEEIFFTYLSFSNSVVADALCEAIEKRDVKVTFVLDEGTETATGEEVLKCKAKTKARNPRMELRGQEGGIGYAHNKIFIVNPSDEKKIRIVFGSGNMTSGIVLHHENWHFITTSPESYFAQAHLCVMEGELDHAKAAKEFKAFMATCLKNIEAEPETDIRAFFVPGGGEAATEAIAGALKWAKTVDIAAHRFSYTTLIEMLAEGLKAEKFSVRLTFDDDMLWAAEGAKRPNMPQEMKKVRQLEKLGAESRYIETNHGQNLLHHNKFLVFQGAGKSAAFVGAGNLTGDAFAKNFENFYFVTVPDVVKKMAAQYEHLYSDLGTAEKDLPKVDVLP